MLREILVRMENVGFIDPVTRAQNVGVKPALRQVWGQPIFWSNAGK